MQATRGTSTCCSVDPGDVACSSRGANRKPFRNVLVRRLIDCSKSILQSLGAAVLILGAFCPEAYRLSTLSRPLLGRALKGTRAFPCGASS
eukprot:1421414-Pyramimonas_sp.AAC.1